MLGTVVGRLAAMSSHTVDGTYWWTPPELLPDHQRAEHPKGHVDFGVAHGQPGPIWALAAAKQAGIDVGTVLDDAVDWLLAHQLDSPLGRFTYTTTLDGSALEPARLAWCYGDLGIAATLMAAAQMVGRADWRVEAAAIARLAANRSVESSGVTDAGLCHGAAGVGHLFHRLHDATGDADLADASQRWLDLARGMPEPEHAGFLNGPVGVELALLASTTDVDPGWDRLLLASPAPTVAS